MKFAADDLFEILDEDAHVEWTLLQKISRIDAGRKTLSRSWPSVDDKLKTLCQECQRGKIVGIAARECLTVGGKKHLMWIDIDTSDRPRVDEWLRTQRVIVPGSYVHLKSTTLNSHLYVVTDRPLGERYEARVREVLRMTMPADLREGMDRVYGPESMRAIFLPMLDLSCAVLPQHLVARLGSVTRLSSFLR